jgi:outer membrane protein assembly factor BamB
MRIEEMRIVVASIALAAFAALPAGASDWPEWRGPNRDGVSADTGLPSRWSPAGEGLAWKAPYGSRSAPVVFGNRLYLWNASVDTVKEREKVQERLLCLDADTGRVVWEKRFNVLHSDVPAHRVGWASPSVDPATGNVYAFGVDGQLHALDATGKLLWQRQLTEEFGEISTHGGRTVSPVIEGNLVIVSTLNSGWGDQARGSNRYFAFDKANGSVVWISAPQSKHYDTNYSTPAVLSVAGRRLLVVGGSDGTFHGIEATTGRPIWHLELSKRAILTSVAFRGTTVYLTHSEENLDTSEMGMVGALDAGQSGTLTPDKMLWHSYGFQGGFASPVVDAERLYQVDNGAVLGAFELATGKKLWERPLGTIQKASPVLADGKLYVGTENGRFYVIKPTAAGPEILDQDQLGTEAAPEAIIASPAVARGRIYLASMDALYAIGPKGAPKGQRNQEPGRSADGSVSKARTGTQDGSPSGHDVAVAQLVPYEVLVKPGEAVRYRLRLFDDKGRFVREEAGASLAFEGLKGAAAGLSFTPAADAGPQAGVVKAAVGTLSASARVRVIPPLPWSFDFEGTTGEAPPPFWVNSTGKFFVRDHGGSRALMKRNDIPLTKRGRLFLGPNDASDYTVEVDVLSSERRRQMGDGGAIAQRYALVLFGNAQKLELHPWQANPARTVEVPFAWNPETWYRVKLRVDNRADGSTQVRGKAWPAAEPEPAAWAIDHVDRMPHRHGAAGVYADASAEVFFDNIKVTPNR